MGLVAPQHVGSSRTWAQTHVPCIGRQILNHCATREVHHCILESQKWTTFLLLWLLSCFFLQAFFLPSVKTSCNPFFLTPVLRIISSKWDVVKLISQFYNSLSEFNHSVTAILFCSRQNVECDLISQKRIFFLKIIFWASIQWVLFFLFFCFSWSQGINTDLWQYFFEGMYLPVASKLCQNIPNCKKCTCKTLNLVP